MRWCFLFVFANTVFATGEVLAQPFTAPEDSLQSVHELYDPSLINNETFLLVNEVTAADQLQFIYDDLERIADTTLQTRHVSLRTRAMIDPDAAAQSEYQSGLYHGSPIKTVSRLVAKNDDILLSFVEAKDPGEPLYFDDLTGCFAITHSIPITDGLALSKFVAGDYSLSFGSGLLFSGSSTQLSTRRVTLNPSPRSNRIQPYISSSSFRYFRGAAAEITSGILSISGFFSDRMVDASLDSSGRTIISLPATGYHRTTLELSRKDQAESKVAGGHIAITPLQDKNFLEFGATAYSLNYDKPVVPNDSLSLGFRGQKHSMISFDMRSIFSVIFWNAEFARMISDAGTANAFAITLLGAPAEWVEVSVNYHALPQRFISPFGSTFGINAADAQNETGWYFGSKISAVKNRFWFYGSANITESQNSMRSAVHYSDIVLGSEYRMTFLPIDLNFQFRSYGKGPAFSITGDSLSKNSYRLDADATLSKTISISLRTEFQRTYSDADGLEKNGHLIGIKLHYAPVRELSVSSGIAFFETDSYAARFYSNEADLPGSAQFVALYGTGYRYYLQFSYEVANRLTVSARAAETKYSPTPGSTQFHRTTIGGQLDLAF